MLFVFFSLSSVFDRSEHFRSCSLLRSSWCECGREQAAPPDGAMQCAMTERPAPRGDVSVLARRSHRQGSEMPRVGRPPANSAFFLWSAAPKSLWAIHVFAGIVNKFFFLFRHPYSVLLFCQAGASTHSVFVIVFFLHSRCLLVAKLLFSSSDLRSECGSELFSCFRVLASRLCIILSRMDGRRREVRSSTELAQMAVRYRKVQHWL